MTARGSLGRTLHRLPRGLRTVLPPAMRQSIRHRIGPFAPWELGFSADAPALAEGESTGPPDFVGIGMQKAGTTWWFDLITAHPGVHHDEQVHKERHFFARFATEAFGPAQIEQYHRWFPRPAGTITGEWTPDYVAQPWAAPLLHAAAPDARLLVMVRDPVERFLSGVAHAELELGSNLGTVLSDAVQRGFYASLLEPWTLHFGVDRLLVLQYERCVAHPEAELERTLRFVGVDGLPSQIRPEEKVSPTRGAKLALDAGARRRLVELYATDVDRLVSRFPHVDVGLWPNFSGR